MILTVFYLWKDIWRQWLTNPLSFGARIAVAVFLFALALGLERYFNSVERAIEVELQEMGLNRIVLSQNLYGEQIGVLRGSLDGVMETAAAEADQYIYLRRVPQVADVELAGRRPIYGYRDTQLTALQKVFPEMTQPGAYLFAPELPTGTRLSALIADLQIDLQVIGKSHFGFSALGIDRFILIPSEWIGWLEESGFTEVVVYQSPHSSPESLESELAALSSLLRLEGLDEVNVQSGFALLERLETLRNQHARWSLLAELFAGLLIVIVFASTGFLEYRQSAYLSALLQSMGVGRGLLSMRYLFENLILLTGAFLSAFLAVTFAVHHYLPQTFGVELTPLTIQSIAPSLQDWLPLIVITATASFVPIGLGLRREVGCVLQ